MTIADFGRYLQRKINIVLILIFIVGLIVSFAFVYFIEKRKKIRRQRRSENNKGKFEYMRKIVKDK